MTMMNMSMGVISQKVTRTDQHGGKNDPAPSKDGFDRAVMAKTEKRMPRMQRGDEAATNLRDLILTIAIEDGSTPQQAADKRTQKEKNTAPVIAMSEAENDEIPDIIPAISVTIDPKEAPVIIALHEMSAQISSRGNEPAAQPPSDDAINPVSVAATSRATPAPETLPVDAGGKPAGPVVQPDSPAPQRAQSPAPTGIQRPEPAMAGEHIGDLTQPRISVLGFSTSLAPAAPAITPGATVAGLVSAIETEPSWRAAAQVGANTTQRGQSHHSVSSLRIQLNPAELGMVTVRLTASGPQLAIEIRTESNDARQRLANDSDAIIKALRTIGFDIDKVTIQQAAQNSGTTAQNGTAQGRDGLMQEQGQAQADTNARGRNEKESGQDGQASRRMAQETAHNITGGDVYI